MTANRKFQIAWNKILKGMYKRKDTRFSGILQYSNRMNKQIELANSYGKIRLTILGDSNAENLANYQYMKKFDPIGLSINLAISGTRADQWEYFLTKTERGKNIYSKIQDSMILWNIGGNHILQNKMDVLEKSLQELKRIFPYSFNCLVPPIWSKYLHFNQTQLEINQRIKLCNQIITEIWGKKTIDTYTPFLNPDTNEPYIITHKDLVHFSKFGNAIRIPIILYSLLKFG